MLLDTNLVDNVEEVKQKTGRSRLDELVQQYEDPIKSIVHGLLEKYVHDAFNEFMYNRIGEEVVRESDGKSIIDYRNGNRTVKQVVIDTLALHDFQIPRNRTGGFLPDILKRTGNRAAGRFALLALELFVNGVSTRKVRRAFERASIKVFGLSKSTVSRITKELINEYIAWSNRRITLKFEYLQADTVYIKVRKNSPKRVGTLMIVGITKDGYKEILHFTLGTESESNFDEILNNLIRRGFDISSIKLVTIDGAKGPINSVRANFGDDKLQRCTVHKTENIVKKAPKILRAEIKSKLHRLWNQSSKIQAEAFLKELYNEYRDTARNAMDCLIEDIDDLLRFYYFPMNHRITIRSTNLIERVNREVRRRTKVMDSLDNEYGCYGILMGVVREQNNRWFNKSHWKRK